MKDTIARVFQTKTPISDWTSFTSTVDNSLFYIYIYILRENTGNNPLVYNPNNIKY